MNVSYKFSNFAVFAIIWVYLY